jgi:hypothetical protein
VLRYRPDWSRRESRAQARSLLLYSVIKPVLETAEFHYRVKRADEDADPGMIGNQMITDIINADLVVADLTDLNPNAFYELGIRHSAQGKTIHIAREGTTLPFDNVAHRTIFVDLMDWHSQERARRSLAEAVRVTKRTDYKVSNPITQANANFQMRQSGDPRDQAIAQFSERLAALEGAFGTRGKLEHIITPPGSTRIDVSVPDERTAVTLIHELSADDDVLNVGRSEGSPDKMTLEIEFRTKALDRIMKLLARRSVLGPISVRGLE